MINIMKALWPRMELGDDKKREQLMLSVVVHEDDYGCFYVLYSNIPKLCVTQFRNDMIDMGRSDIDSIFVMLDEWVSWIDSHKIKA